MFTRSAWFSRICSRCLGDKGILSDHERTALTADSAEEM
jgi:hypothetical protein